MNPRRLLALLAAGIFAASTAVAAPPEGKGKPDKNKGHSQQESKSHSNNGGSDWDEVAFRTFAGQQRYSGYDSLPPGIRKNLARGKPLPPGIAKRDVPPDLLRRLPVRDGYEWRAVGTDLILYSIAGGIIDQVLQDVFLD